MRESGSAKGLEIGNRIGVIADLIIGGKKVTTKTKRWYKDVGLGFRTPAGKF
jgi:hypothetical protein